MDSNTKGKTFLSAKLKLACVKLVDRFHFLWIVQEWAIANRFLPPKLCSTCVGVFLQKIRCEKAILTVTLSLAANLFVLASFCLFFS